MKRILILAALLAGCTHPDAAPPAIEVRTQTVTVEVQKPCPVTMPDRPGKLAQPLPIDAVQLAAVLALKLAEYAGPGGYADRADAAIETCIKAK